MLAGWYEYVGQSFMILLFIQLLIPFINILIDFAIKWIKRGLVRCNEDATQVRCICSLNLLSPRE